MSRDLVLLSRFDSSVEAELAKGRLQLEGIPVAVSTEAVSGRVELRVPAFALEDARALLEAPVESSAQSLHWETGSDQVRCPICEASFVETEQASWPVRLLRALLLSVVPLPTEWFEASNRRCGVCGYRWKEAKGVQHDPSGVAPVDPGGTRGWRR